MGWTWEAKQSEIKVCVDALYQMVSFATIIPCTLRLNASLRDGVCGLLK
jgi:hypothetical protein